MDSIVQNALNGISTSLKLIAPIFKNKLILISKATGFFGKWFLLKCNKLNQDYNLSLEIYEMTRNKKKIFIKISKL